MVVSGTTENRMASSIDATKPTTGTATTSSVRDNFTLAKTEINELMRATEDQVTAAGNADALTADFVTNVVLAEGVTICIKAASANATATPTLNVDGTGAKTIVKDSGAALVAGNIAGSRHRLILKYDASNTVWVLINPAETGTLYPVGSIYTNAAVATNPGTLLGFGTWEAFGTGRVMIGIDSGNALFDAVGETGGSANSPAVNSTTGSTAITIAQMPAHTHPGAAHSTSGIGDFVIQGAQGLLSRLRGYVTPSTSTSFVPTQGGGAGHTHSITNGTTTNANYQPFITVYMWKRTA